MAQFPTSGGFLPFWFFSFLIPLSRREEGPILKQVAEIPVSDNTRSTKLPVECRIPSHVVVHGNPPSPSISRSRSVVVFARFDVPFPVPLRPRLGAGPDDIPPMLSPVDTGVAAPDCLLASSKFPSPVEGVGH